ncbi:hypothetical protein F5Y01DRAFT_133954 [Xylaria sp. FL0043]|nr:hypothetical protein F5Y01DRAFT_133954 [Xylaria sp. FL0043]
MVTRALYAGVLALWFLADHVLSDTITAVSSTPPNSALLPTSTFVSPSLNLKDGGGLSESMKVGVSIGVTLAAIIIVGATAILCVIRRRNRTLMKPQTRALPSRDFQEENMFVGDASGKDKGAHYMNGSLNAQAGQFQQAQDGFVYHGGEGGYPTIPGQTYAPNQQIQPMSYPIAPYGETYVYPSATYPGTTVADASQHNGYAGPSNTQYQPEAHLQQAQQHQHHQQQQYGGDISWIYPASTLSPVEAAPAQDSHYKYLQNCQHQMQNSNAGHDQSQNENTNPTQKYQNDTYYVPPRPNASELPDERKPVELMGEGHYKEVP